MHPLNKTMRAVVYHSQKAIIFSSILNSTLFPKLILSKISQSFPPPKKKNKKIKILVVAIDGTKGQEEWSSPSYIFASFLICNKISPRKKFKIFY